MTPHPFARATGQPRDPARIDIVLSALRAYWLANPDMRLGQIVVNAAGGGGPFVVEDDALMAGWPKPAPARAPRTCWDCRSATNFAGCAHPQLNIEGPGTIAEWANNGNISSETLMPTPTATPCPGFTERSCS